MFDCMFTYRVPSSYPHARLLEINSHSLFSKWFSESGKLVQRLFTSITELAEEEDAFLVVLIGLCLSLYKRYYCTDASIGR